MNRAISSSVTPGDHVGADGLSAVMLPRIGAGAAFVGPLQLPLGLCCPTTAGLAWTRPEQRQEAKQRVALSRFVARVNALGRLSRVSPMIGLFLLDEVKVVARSFDVGTSTGLSCGYDRRVLHEDATGWSLAAIVMRPGQQTDAHDHGGWGCAVTVQGIERDRRFAHDAAGNLVLSSERDYPRGSGYVFDARDVHQPVGADPRRVTVALHFLIYESSGDRGQQRHAEGHHHTH